MCLHQTKSTTLHHTLLEIAMLSVEGSPLGEFCCVNVPNRLEICALWQMAAQMGSRYAPDRVNPQHHHHHHHHHINIGFECSKIVAFVLDFQDTKKLAVGRNGLCAPSLLDQI